MNRHFPALLLVFGVATVAAIGCQPHQPFYFFEDGDLSHYLDMATEIEYPDVDSDTLSEVDGAIAPLTLENTEPKEVWDLTLEEAVRIALENSKVIRSQGSFASSPVSSLLQNTSPVDHLLRSPETATTIYDPARFESSPLSGVEAALSAFDTQFMTEVFWQKNDEPLNINPAFVAPPLAMASTFRQQLGDFVTEVKKTAATGGTWAMRHKVGYNLNNNRREFYSNWTVQLEAEFTQPLLQGNGVQFNRIAGPGAIPGQNSGVMIARVNTDVALADFEAQVRDLVMDVEKTYWAVYLAYRQLDAMTAGRDSALQTWRKIHALYEVSARGGEAEKEAQAREQYFLFRSQVEEQLSNLYEAESKLRYLMGLAATDGRLIRPADEPTTARVSFDWYESHGEGLARNVAIRRQKWKVKKAEMELIAAKNYLLPRLDAVGRYRYRGLGDHLLNPTPQPYDFDNAYLSMSTGRYQEWHLGLNLSIPIGFRKEMAGVRHAQLNLARERAMLQEEELELSHQLANAVRTLDRHYVLSKTNFNRRVAAAKQVDAVTAAYETETVTLDLLLDAQRRLAQAELAMFGSLSEYAVSIANMHYRKGSLLEYNGVYLAEGPWPGKAYFDAHQRARRRDASLYLDYGFTRPNVMSRGAYDQRAGQNQSMLGDGEPIYDVIQGGEALQTLPEEIPVPKPEEPGVLPEATPSVPMPPEAAGMEGIPADGPRLGAVNDSAVRQVSYEEAAGGPDIFALGSRLSSAGWKSTNRPSTANAAPPNPPTAQADRSSSGWSGVQR